ncbi:MAG TPA: glycosyltransferase family 4 protein [Steroidobacter sp.]|uniref:glycosyltransferase family 4 protein n=1 Tax=Steroidobacter sp. TaxID=1978227 RepID=UPI002EDA4FCD
MRRIVLLVSSLGGGGAERVAATLGNAWARSGAEVVIVPTFLGDHRSAYPLEPGVRIVWLSDRMNSGGFIGKLRALRGLVRELEPEIVISFLTNVNVVALLALAGVRVPLVISERVDPAASVEMSWVLRLARRALYQFADALVVQTNEAAMRYRALLVRPPPTIVIPNPLPASLDASSTRAAPAASGGGQLTAMGRLTSQKQFDLLIHAFSKAFATEQTWTLSIWGEGPLRHRLQQLIDELGLNGRVQLCGSTTQPWAVLASAQMFVLSSAYEGFPNAMLEAMALGLPCVAFDCPSGPRDLAAGDVALLVPPQDVDALARTMKALAQDSERRLELGRAAAESVRSRFSEAAVLAQWQKIFERCGSGRASSSPV